jgi:hypothetical protein
MIFKAGIEFWKQLQIMNNTQYYPFKDEAQTALFKAPVRTAL